MRQGYRCKAVGSAVEDAAVVGLIAVCRFDLLKDVLPIRPAKIRHGSRAKASQRIETMLLSVLLCQSEQHDTQIIRPTLRPFTPDA